MNAATTIVALRVCALALAIIGIRSEVLPEEPEGSVMLELAPLPLSAAMEAVDMPPGPVVETERVADTGSTAGLGMAAAATALAAGLGAMAFSRRRQGNHR